MLRLQRFAGFVRPGHSGDKSPAGRVMAARGAGYTVRLRSSDRTVDYRTGHAALVSSIKFPRYICAELTPPLPFPLFHTPKVPTPSSFPLEARRFSFCLLPTPLHGFLSLPLPFVLEEGPLPFMRRMGENRLFLPPPFLPPLPPPVDRPFSLTVIACSPFGP